MFKSKFVICSFLIGCSTVASAQDEYAGQGYVHASMGATRGGTGLLGVTGGGEAFLWKGLSAQGELGYLFPVRAANDGIGVASVGPAYHFTDRSRSQKLVPFVDGGYTLAFRSGTLSLWHIGGGATWWYSDRFGLQFGVRNYAHQGEHFATAFRVGFTFR